MPFKAKKKQRKHFKKSIYRVKNWSDYNKALKQRGNLKIWLSPDVIDQWIQPDRVYDGTGCPNLYSDMAILTCHEIRQIFKLPLRQTEGFINSLFKQVKVDLKSPDYTVLSRRLSKLKIKTPYYRKCHKHTKDLYAVAIDSSGLTSYSQEDWKETSKKLDQKRDWRKLHISVDNDQIIQSCELTDRDTHDSNPIDELLKPLGHSVQHISADAAYDQNKIYKSISKKCPNANIVIPPKEDAIWHKRHHFYRNRNLLERKYYGKIEWQKRQEYGWRNHSEIAFMRYKKILGGTLHAREFSRQQQEVFVGCSVLNKLTGIGMPETFKVA